VVCLAKVIDTSIKFKALLDQQLGQQKAASILENTHEYLLDQVLNPLPLNILSTI
jgi:hypothetical protein